MASQFVSIGLVMVLLAPIGRSAGMWRCFSGHDPAGDVAGGLTWMLDITVALPASPVL